VIVLLVDIVIVLLVDRVIVLLADRVLLVDRVIVLLVDRVIVLLVDIVIVLLVDIVIVLLVDRVIVLLVYRVLLVDRVLPVDRVLLVGSTCVNRKLRLSVHKSTLQILPVVSQQHDLDIGMFSEMTRVPVTSYSDSSIVPVVSSFSPNSLHVSFTDILITVDVKQNNFDSKNSLKH